MQDPTSSAVFFTSRCWDQNVKGLVSIFLVPTSGLILKLPLKRNFGLIIKFEPYLETLLTFFLHAVSENCFFRSSKLTG